MTHLQVPIPFKGLHQDAAFSAQPMETSADLLNVRPFDPVSRRRRLSKREGTSKYNANRLSNNKVRFLGQIVTDGRKNTYAASSGSTETSITTARVQESRGGCLDRQGNFYALDGKSNITKYNVDGNVVWTFQPPISEPSQELCIPFVDDQDNLYVGVQAGGSQTTAKVWRFTQDKGSATPTKQWEVTPGAYVRRVLVRGDLVYLGLNYPDRYGSYVVQYTGALDTGLTESWRTVVAYPINDLVLKPDGALLGCSLPFVNRWKDPRYPNFTRKTVDAQPRDILSNFDARVWRWHQGETLATTLDDGDSVSVWPDISGKGRSLFTSMRASKTLPKFHLNGVNGIPSVYFRGDNATGASTGISDELQSEYSASTNSAYSDGANGLVPSYSGAKWVMFLVFRTEQIAGRIQSVFGQAPATGGVTSPNTLFVNRNDAGAATTGVGCWHEIPIAGTGAGLGAAFAGPSNQYPLQFTFSSSGNDSGVCLITLVCDGGDTTADAANTITHSLLRYNGHPVDRWVSTAPASTDAGYVGDSHSTTASEWSFRGEIMEMIVLRDNTSATKGLIGHYNYPHDIHAYGVAPTANNYSATTPQNADEMQRMEGYLAHKYGIAHLLTRSVEANGAATNQTYTAGPPTVINVAGVWPHPYSLATTGAGVGPFSSSSGWNGPPRATASLNRSEPFLMHGDAGVAWKLDAARGALQWVVAGGPTEDGGGIGYSITCSNDGQIIYSAGPQVLSGTTNWKGLGSVSNDYTVLRAWKDKNATGEDGYSTSTVIGQSGWIVTNTITATGVSWTDATRTLTGTFTNYVFTAGDVVRVTAGTNAIVANYSIASGNATTLVLQAGDGVKTSASSDASTAGNETGWSVTIIPSWQTTDIKIDVDDSDNVHVPWAFAAGTSACLKVYARQPDGSGASNVGRLLVSYDDSTHCDAYCAVCPPSPTYRLGTVTPADFNRNPADLVFTGANWTESSKTITGTFTGYEFNTGDTVTLKAGTGVTLGTYTITSGSTSALGLTPSDITAGGNVVDSSIQGVIQKAVSLYARSEFTWLGVAQTGTLPNTTAGILKVRLVTATPTGDPPRAQTLVQVVNGVVAKFTTTTMPTFAGPSTLSSPQLSTASTYIAGAVAFNKLFLTDGEKYVYVDPINDTVLSYKSTDGGKIPERCKLMVNWRGRIVIARGVDSPQQWHMSALGNPFSWNQFPIPRLSTRAISGVNARIGLAPDDINCLIPYTDNVLIFGCDSTIWAMVGDPADEGSVGGFRQVSRTTGMAFGRPWAIDPEGIIYFFGSRGGVWRMTPGSEPQSISDQQIDSLLRDADLGTYRVELVWDDEWNVLRVMFCGSAEAIHYVWDREDKGWWTDQLPYGVETLLTIDGDAPGDRKLVMGCADGYIRKWDSSVYNDDGTAITSRFLIGPVTPQDSRNKWRFRDFRAQMSATQDPLTMNVYESDTPDNKGTLRLTTVLQPGRNKSRPLQACGPYVWFQGTHSTASKRWSVESMSVEAIPVGRAHVV